MPVGFVILWLAVPAIVAIAYRRFVTWHVLSRRRFVVRCAWTLTVYYIGTLGSYALAWAIRASTGQESTWVGIGCLLLLANPAVCGLIVIHAHTTKDIQWRGCPKCAYPIGTSEVCTECGAAVTPKAVTV